jgi:hypothetical protein
MKWNEPAPSEREAGERSWHVVRAAWAARTPLPRPHRSRGRLVAIAFALVILAAILSPPGLAVLGSIRDAVRGEQNAKPALFSLPSPGRLLVQSSRGAWVVQSDGSKRLLAGYRDASWSPHGLYLAAVQDHELRALEPNGKVHWSLARGSAIRFPVWSDATRPCCRIAYLAGQTLRVVNGDGTGDHLVAAHVANAAPVWRPRTHQLAYVESSGRVRVVNADTLHTVAAWRRGTPEQLAWSADGRLVAARTREHPIFVLRPDGTFVEGMSTASLAPGNPFTAFAFGPRAGTLAVVSHNPVTNRSVVSIDALFGGTEQTVFSGPGLFDGVNWSPNGRWLVLHWVDADQLLFIRIGSARKLPKAVANIAADFGANAMLSGWCCP